MNKTTNTYRALGGCYIEASSGHATLADACQAIRAQRTGMVEVAWPDGSVAFYTDQDSAERDQTGERAIALATRCTAQDIGW